MLLALLACQNPVTEDHPGDEVKPFPYDDGEDPLVPEDSETSCEDGYVEQSRKDVFGESLCLAFAEATSYLGLNDTSKHIGVYTFDFNSDGAPDIFVSNDDAASNLYTLEEGAYDDATEELGFTYHYEDRADEAGLKDFHPRDVAAKDFDDDGDIDLAIAGPENLVLVNSAGTFTAYDASFGNLDGQTGKSVAWLGTDLVFGTDSGISYFNHTGGTNFEEVTHDVGIYDYDDVGALAVGDVDNDGDEDFFAGKEVGTDRLFINDGGNFSDASVESDDTQAATQAEFVQLSPDEELALSLTRNGSDGFLVCDEDYAFEDQADEFGLTSPNNTTSATYADLTGEGIQTVYKTNHQSQNELLIRTVSEDGSYGYFSDYAILTGVDFNDKSTGSAALDYNGDGLTDFVSVAEDGAIHLVANYTRFLE